MKHLFEFGEWQTVDNPQELKASLHQLWQSRLYAVIRDEDANSHEAEEGRRNQQPFLQFDGSNMRANNFVGFIQHGNQLIEIYPKVFRADNCQDKALMLRHIFFWFDHCRRWKLPYSEAGLKSRIIDSFPELIIHLMARQIHDTIFAQPFFAYTPVEEALLNPRGHLNFKRYIGNSLCRGRNQYLECDHEPFVFDNKVNRIIKYAARLLRKQARQAENTRLLDSCLHMLDEVEDKPTYEEEIEGIILNRHYHSYEQLLLTCRLIIGQRLYSSESFDLQQWALLFPMEYLFEDFLAGFIEDHFSGPWKVEYQKADAYLSNEPQVFNMQHDIYLTGKGRKVIIDTKYKIRDRNFKADPKKGISQADLYQVVSYAVKRGCHEVFLLYPNITEELAAPDVFRINTGFENIETITVTALEVPFWSRENFQDIPSRLKNMLATHLSL